MFFAVVFFVFLFGATVGTYFPVFTYLFLTFTTLVSEIFFTVRTCDKVSFYFSSTVRTIGFFEYFLLLVFLFDDTREDIEVFFDFEIVFFKYRSTWTDEEIEKYSQRSKYYHYQNRKYLE